MKRRNLLNGLLAGAATLSMPRGLVTRALASASSQQRLAIVRRTIEVNGKAATVFGLTGTDGKSGLRFTEGENFNVLLSNSTGEGTIIHWHGLTPPWPNDGVPDAPTPQIGAGEQRSYDFPVGKPGTHWMHAHTLQEQALLAAPLIVSSAQSVDEQEVVMLLHDFSFKSPEELLSELSNAAGAAPMEGMDHSSMDMSSGAGTTSMSGMPADINDIEYDAYLSNDRTLDDPEVVDVERGGRVRLRIINGATATAFTIDLGDLAGQLVAVDGQDVVPIAGSSFPLSMGQRIDVLLTIPPGASAIPILALREGAPQRTGIILRPSGAAVSRIASEGSQNGPVLDLELEAQLIALTPLVATETNKSFEMMLNGDMATYRWSLALNDAILVDRGDRVEITFMNMSMMAHPMHLHGHHFQVVAIDGRRFAGAMRDTVLIPPMRSVTVAVDAGNPGQWALHCHNLYHMASGMMSTFAYRS